MLKIEHVSKEYNLGTIGGGTLKAEIQSKLARLRQKDDPNLKIGQTAHGKNERFLALDDVNLEIRKGERVGIIGHNGAGKSTLLKLICRVTAPTKGNIYINGRITSMLEVGTGFHGELTGKENVYMNGAILGMTKDEIDAKYDDIVKFSEVEKFIDTPIKRYSSGMNIKLGFSIASHLDSEIMIMDEVLAVGDAPFQKKCLDKMREVAKTDGRTILYVSHNMSTIRSLCERVIVLNHGKVIHDGEVETGIRLYSEMENTTGVSFSFKDVKRGMKRSLSIELLSLEVLDKEKAIFSRDESVSILLNCKANADVKAFRFRFEFLTQNDKTAGVAFSDKQFSASNGDHLILKLTFSLKNFAPGSYRIGILPFEWDEEGNFSSMDQISNAMHIEVVEKTPGALKWDHEWWGSVQFDDMKTNIIEVRKADAD